MPLPREARDALWGVPGLFLWAPVCVCVDQQQHRSPHGPAKRRLRRETSDGRSVARQARLLGWQEFGLPIGWSALAEPTRREQVQAESLVGIEIAMLELETSGLGQVADLPEGIFVRVLGMDSLLPGEGHLEIESVDSDLLSLLTFEKALDTSRVLVVVDTVSEAPQIEAALELSIDSSQQIEIETGRDALTVIVGAFERRSILSQINSDQHPIVGSHLLSASPEEGRRRLASQIADRRAQPEQQLGPEFEGFDRRETLLVLRHGRQDFDLRMSVPEPRDALFEGGAGNVDGGVAK